MQPHVLTASVGERSEDKLLAALGVIVTVDGIKADILGITKEQLYAHPDLKFKFSGSRDSGEIHRDWAIYRGMKFTVKPFYDQKKHPGKYSILIEGSLHVYANEGLHNADELTFGRLLWAIHDLRERFGISLVNNLKGGLETGLNNRKSGHTPTDILKSMLTYKTEPLSIFTIKGSDGRLAEIGQHILKAYDKGKQYSGFPGTFRLEDRFTKKEKFNEAFGIVTLADLCQPIKLASLARHLIALWNDLLIFDVALKQEEFLSQFSKSKQVEILRWADPHYWLALQKNSKGTKKNRYYRPKKEFEEFHAQHSSMKEDVLKAIESKIAPLLALAESPEAHRWEELLALAAETETGKVAEVGKNDRVQTPAIIAAREELAAPDTHTPTQAMGRNDRFQDSRPAQIVTEGGQQPRNPNEGNGKEEMGKNDTIPRVSEFPTCDFSANSSAPAQGDYIDWDELNRPEPWELDPF
jgi:hypothetical protein